MAAFADASHQPAPAPVIYVIAADSVGWTTPPTMHKQPRKGNSALKRRRAQSVDTTDAMERGFVPFLFEHKSDGYRRATSRSPSPTSKMFASLPPLQPVKPLEADPVSLWSPPSSPSPTSTTVFQFNGYAAAPRINQYFMNCGSPHQSRGIQAQPATTESAAQTEMDFGVPARYGGKCPRLEFVPMDVETFDMRSGASPIVGTDGRVLRKAMFIGGSGEPADPCRLQLVQPKSLLSIPNNGRGPRPKRARRVHLLECTEVIDVDALP
jgi:hypothetical protein